MEGKKEKLGFITFFHSFDYSDYVRNMHINKSLLNHTLCICVLCRLITLEQKLIIVEFAHYYTMK